MAADLCVASHIDHLFLNYEKNKEILDDYKHFYNQDTVPIILENNMESGITKKIGGYSDLLSALESEVKISDETNKKSLKVSVSLLEQNRKHIFSLKEKVNSLISDFYKEEYHISSTSLITLMEIFFSVSVAIRE